jgi:hypothetical protein
MQYQIYLPLGPTFVHGIARINQPDFFGRAIPYR